MNRAGGSVPGDPAEAMREAAERAARSAIAGTSHARARASGFAASMREGAAGLLRTDQGALIPIDATGRALIRDDQVGARRDSAYLDWLQGLRDRGFDAETVLTDLRTVWDFLRRDPKWEFDPDRNYGGVVMFGSPDIGGAAALTQFTQDRGLSGIPVVFSGYADPSTGAAISEAVRFRIQAERVGLGAHRIIEDHLARNTGENAYNSLELLRRNGRDTGSVVGVCTPQHARRVWGTIMRNGPEVGHAAMITADVSVENYLRYGLRTDITRPTPPDDIASAIMGEIKRLDEYPAEGHIVAQPVPGDIRDAYDRLGEVFRPTEKRF